MFVSPTDFLLRDHVSKANPRSCRSRTAVALGFWPSTLSTSMVIESLRHILSAQTDPGRFGIMIEYQLRSLG